MPNTSRRSLLTGAATVAAATLGGAGQATAAPTFKLTELGRYFIALLPAHAEAVWDDCNTIDSENEPGYDAELVAQVDRRVSASWKVLGQAEKAILAAAREAPIDHFCDLAVLIRYGCATDNAVEEASRLLASEILRLGGAHERDCCGDEIYAAVQRRRRAFHDRSQEERHRADES